MTPDTPSYSSIRSPIRRLAHRLLTLSVTHRHSGKEKVTLDDLFLLHSMDGATRVDVPWHVAKFFTNKAKGYKKKSLIIGVHLIGKISRSYGLMTQRSLKNVTLGPETLLLSVAKLVDLGICRLRASDERLGGIETNISTLSIEVDDLTYVVSGMSEQYDQFYNEFRQMRVQQGVNFMSNTPVYSTAPSSSPNPFGLSDDANVGPFTSQNLGNDID
nr:hypothetical protein [Tanacetum cinerariifolium]